MIRRSMWPRLGALGALGGLQGLIGWWMVRSGLDTATFDPDGEEKEARVNPYRLATHLSMAFCLHAGLVWTAMDHLLGARPRLGSAVASMAGLDGPARGLRRVKAVAVAGTGLLGLTVVAGALVAGNDAGRAYNTFPLMAGRLTPPREDALRYAPLWRNWFESTALTQWNHRVLGCSTAATMAALLVAARRPATWRLLDPLSRRCLWLIGAGATAQASLGVAALLSYVPVTLGSMHQCGALALWTVGIVLCHSLRPLRSHGGARLAMERLARWQAATAARANV
jgi:cytochrome c oxidase assembly protein subunit 15